MSDLSTKSNLHTRISNFVKWIAPDPEKRNEINEQVEDIRIRISNNAKEDGLTITATPRTGSFARNTGLRRHMRGDSDVEGQDIDVLFVVKPPKEDEYQLGSMIDKFYKYASDSYPKTEKDKTKSSVKLKFTSTLAYDLVPLFATKDPEKQILVRSTGEQIETSEQKHTEFITNRTTKSDEKKGVVRFNECVRLVKWWREVRCAEANYLKEVPSIIVDLLCAKAFDRLSVQTTYAQTMAEWFAYLAHVVKKREQVAFSDYTKVPIADTNIIWQVIDPVNPENNVANKLQSYEVDELAEWFGNGRDAWNRVIVADLGKDDTKSLEQLVGLFGNSFNNHCEE
jgi:tRNA nucleotidyltransferase (CCA-adding enzyme)